MPKGREKLVGQLYHNAPPHTQEKHSREKDLSLCIQPNCHPFKGYKFNFHCSCKLPYFMVCIEEKNKIDSFLSDFPLKIKPLNILGVVF